MSNTTVPISEWCKEIRVALARKEMNLQSVADEIGYSYTTITALISGRIVKDNYLDIAKKINEVLEVNVLPEKPQLPSDEWCGAVRAKLYVKKMNISELSKSIGFNRDKTELFAMACGAYLDIIAETFNSQGIPNLIDINGDHFAGITDYPKLTHGDIEDADIAKVSAFVKDMVGIGVLVPDDGLEDYIRQIGKLPERTDDTRELSQTREEQQGQNEPPEPETAAGKEPKEDDEEISEEAVEAAKKRLGRV